MVFVLQGQKYDNRYPIAILFVLCILGGICGSFLPETLHQKLPDSMTEARLFGADQVCFDSIVTGFVCEFLDVEFNETLGVIQPKYKKRKENSFLL